MEQDLDSFTLLCLIVEKLKQQVKGYVLLSPQVKAIDLENYNVYLRKWKTLYRNMINHNMSIYIRNYSNDLRKRQGLYA